jgi:hypothetical protein
MALPDQISARSAAAKFIQSNAAPDHLMAVVEFGGALRIMQNFTANADLLQAAAKGVKTAYVASNSDPGGPGATAINIPGSSAFSAAETDYGARSMLLSVRTLAKSLRSIQGRKMLVLFSSGFPFTAERQSELTATIDACNKANVAVYSLDVRGLQAAAPKGGGSAANHAASPSRAALVAKRYKDGIHLPGARLILAAYPDPRRPAAEAARVEPVEPVALVVAAAAGSGEGTEGTGGAGRKRQSRSRAAPEYGRTGAEEGPAEQRVAEQRVAERLAEAPAVPAIAAILLITTTIIIR